mmetsp:Transcript_87810/g.204373  ORF Transcript_87810/g.204373 Transcript_87810/m.204373 type:complete len:359 (+) Transcript_87810:124-1200(+)
MGVARTPKAGEPVALWTRRRRLSGCQRHTQALDLCACLRRAPLRTHVPVRVCPCAPVTRDGGAEIAMVSATQKATRTKTRQASHRLRCPCHQPHSTCLPGKPPHLPPALTLHLETARRSTDISHRRQAKQRGTAQVLWPMPLSRGALAVSSHFAGGALALSSHFAGGNQAGAFARVPWGLRTSCTGASSCFVSRVTSLIWSSSNVSLVRTSRPRFFSTVTSSSTSTTSRSSAIKRSKESMYSSSISSSWKPYLTSADSSKDLMISSCVSKPSRSLSSIRSSFAILSERFCSSFCRLASTKPSSESADSFADSTMTASTKFVKPSCTKTRALPSSTSIHHFILMRGMAQKPQESPAMRV